jgi:hypothetical protein
VPSDFTITFRKPMVIFNGECYEKSFAAILVSGGVHPRFCISTVSQDKIINRKAIITASEDNTLKELDGAPAVEFLDSLGIVKKGRAVGLIGTIPLVIDFKDGTQPIVRLMSEVTPEGYLVLGGAAPVGCTLMIGGMDYDNVMQTLSEVVKEATREPCDVLLLFSCMTRNFILGLDNMDEINFARSNISGVPFLFTYSGGELCPVQGSEGSGGLTNRFHNLTLAVCIL